MIVRGHKSTRFLFLLIFLFMVACTGEKLEQALNQIPVNASNVQPLLIGEFVPDLPLTDVEGKKITLMELTAGKLSVIVFYRGGWCPFCSAHLVELAALEEDLYALGYQLLAISPDQPEFLRQSLEEQELNYALLSDSSMQVAQAFGVAFQVDNETVQSLKEGGMDIVERSGYDHQLLPVPAVFISDTDGKILFQYVNPNYRERISGEILTAALHFFAN